MRRQYLKSLPQILILSIIAAFLIFQSEWKVASITVGMALVFLFKAIREASYSIEKNRLILKSVSKIHREHRLNDIVGVFQTDETLYIFLKDDVVVMDAANTLDWPEARNALISHSRKLPTYGYILASDEQASGVKTVGCATCLSIGHPNVKKNDTGLFGNMLGRVERKLFCKECGSRSVFVAMESTNPLSQAGLRSWQSIQ